MWWGELPERGRALRGCAVERGEVDAAHHPDKPMSPAKMGGALILSRLNHHETLFGLSQTRFFDSFTASCAASLPRR